MPSALSVDLRCRVRRVLPPSRRAVWGERGQRQPLVPAAGGPGAPHAQAPGRRSALAPHRGSCRVDPALILQTSQARPQIFLRELRDALQEKGLVVSPSSLSRFLARHRISRKKGRSTRLSRSGRTSGRPARPGLQANSTWIRTGSCSWTRPLPIQAWLAGTAGPRVVSAATSRCQRVTGKPPPSSPGCARAGRTRSFSWTGL